MVERTSRWHLGRVGSSQFLFADARRAQTSPGAVGKCANQQKRPMTRVAVEGSEVRAGKEWHMATREKDSTARRALEGTAAALVVTGVAPMALMPAVAALADATPGWALCAGLLALTGAAAWAVRSL